MLVLTVPQIAQSAAGSVPEAFSGKIKKVYPRSNQTRRNPRQGEDPNYTLQKIILAEGSTEVEVMLDNRDEVPAAAAGSTFMAASKMGQRGLAGLKRKDNDYNGKVTPQVWIDDRADITVEGGSAQRPSQPSNGNGSSTQRPQQTNTPPAQKSSTPPPSNGNGSGATPAARAGVIKDFNKRIARATSAYERCFDAAIDLCSRVDERLKAKGGFKPSADTIEKMAACLMVQACWTQKPADMDAFPIRSFAAYDAKGELIGAKQPQQQADPGDGGDDRPPFDA